MKPLKSYRNSSMELLRLVCMLCIVLGHYIGNGLNAKLSGDFLNSRLDIVILSFCIVGVNCFVLLSGYYLIKKPIKASLRVLIEALFYSVLLFFVFSKYSDCFNFKHFLYSILCISHGGLWFISCYIYLCLLSPLLNKALIGTTTKQLIWYVALLTIINEYFGYIHHGSVNPNGFNIMHFIYMYVIGHTLSRIKFNMKSGVALIGYVMFSIVIAFVAILLFETDEELFHRYAFNYNNPLVIVSSIMLFLIFSKFEFISIRLNQLSKGVLAVYLIQGNPYLKLLIYDYIGTLPYIYKGLNLYFFIFILAISTVLIFCLVDTGRQWCYKIIKIDKLIDKMKYE